MFVKVLSATTIGLDGVVIKVEVDVASRGFPKFNIVGLPSKSVEEARERVRTAIINSSFEMPDTRITVNLAPADIPKNGSSFDLPMALGILAASGMVNRDSLAGSIFIGELSLTGKIRKVPGSVAVAVLAKDKKIGRIFIPRDCAYEASLVSGIEVYPADNLADLVTHLNGVKNIYPFPGSKINMGEAVETDYVFENIKGQETVKRAMEIAAVGFHNLHMLGPPGTGKTLLSKSFPSILPFMNEKEILEVTRIYSVSGMLKDSPLVVARPFRSPHHTVSRVGLVGGGSCPAPGEISFSHRGVLFLDEFPEFSRSALESLRGPMEDGEVSISRAAGTINFPCRFILLAASNPCPCGYLGHPKKPCKCSPGAIFNYRKKISGPILDRIDINVDVPPVDRDKLISDLPAETSLAIRKRVTEAYYRQKRRFAGSPLLTNSAMTPKDIKKYCLLTPGAESLLKQAIDRFCLSARSYFKIIKISQTITDLDGGTKISESAVAEALQFRMTDG